MAVISLEIKDNINTLTHSFFKNRCISTLIILIHLQLGQFLYLYLFKIIFTNQVALIEHLSDHLSPVLKTFQN